MSRTRQSQKSSGSFPWWSLAYALGSLTVLTMGACGPGLTAKKDAATPPSAADLITSDAIRAQLPKDFNYTDPNNLAFAKDFKGGTLTLTPTKAADGSTTFAADLAATFIDDSSPTPKKVEAQGPIGTDYQPLTPAGDASQSQVLAKCVMANCLTVFIQLKISDMALLTTPQDPSPTGSPAAPAVTGPAIMAMAFQAADAKSAYVLKWSLSPNPDTSLFLKGGISGADKTAEAALKNAPVVAPGNPAAPTPTPTPTAPGGTPETNKTTPGPKLLPAPTGSPAATPKQGANTTVTPPPATPPPATPTSTPTPAPAPTAADPHTVPLKNSIQPTAAPPATPTSTPTPAPAPVGG